MEETPAIDFSRIADELRLTVKQVENVIALLDGGNTVPFITRYRKEQTGNLDEQQIREVQDRVRSLRQLKERAETIRRLIEAQGKLTPQLQAEIEAAATLKRLEDLYLPYRPKRKSRAEAARQRGLEPLADRIWNGDASLTDLSAAAAEFVNPENELPTTAEVLAGSADILAERISEDAEVREETRKVAWQTGRLTVSATKAGDESGQEYRDYFDFSEPVSRIPPHRALAVNRGDKEGALRVRFEWDEQRAKAAVARQLKLPEHRFRSFLESCAHDALTRLIQPSLEREIRRELTERAESHAVSVFARNLKSLLLQPPLQGRRVLAIDPGFRTGCKLAALDETGHCLAVDVVYVTGSAEKRTAAKQKLAGLMQTHRCDIVAIGNGTACRETEELISEMISEHLAEARYLIVNEAGASIYSTSTVAREEFPELDATARGTISIGRRLQDPLSELVKIDPQHIGVGLYQHDVSPKRLKESLDEVIESCVNYVGVDLNTASASLLRHVSGLNQLIARRVVEWREQHGRFNNRRELLKVPGLGEATFTQAAGFLKISGGDQPLDNTWIHPESYQAAGKLLRRLSEFQPADSDAAQPPGGAEAVSSPPAHRLDPAAVRQFSAAERAALAEELHIGLPTLTDILEALARPGRDPRADLPGHLFKQGVLKLEDLEVGMELQGTILNVVDFGVFVDVGLKDSGLVHVSQMSAQFIRSPHDVAAVGDIVTVWVLGVDRDRRRVSLTMMPPGTNRDAHRPAREKSANNEPPKPQPPRRSTSSTSSTSFTPTPPEPPQSAETGENEKPAAGPQSAKPAKKHSQPPNEITPNQAAGREPLRGFDELKELWSQRKK